MKKTLAVLATIALVSNFGMISFAESTPNPERSGGISSVKEKRPVNMTKEEKIIKKHKEAKKKSK